MLNKQLQYYGFNWFSFRRNYNMRKPIQKIAFNNIDFNTQKIFRKLEA